MRVELLGWSPDLATMKADLKRMGWFEWVDPDQDNPKGYWKALTDVQMSVIGAIVEYDNTDPENPVETKNTGGIHYNLRFYGQKAANYVANFMTKEKTNEDGSTYMGWDFPKMVQAMEAKTGGEKFSLGDKSVTGVKAGWELPGGTRLFLPETIAKRHNVWA